MTFKRLNTPPTWLLYIFRIFRGEEHESLEYGILSFCLSKLFDLVSGLRHKVGFTLIKFNCHLSAVCTSTTSNSVKICSIDFSNINTPHSNLFLVFRMNVCFCCVRCSFFSISQEIGWEECLRNDLYCVEWDIRNMVKYVMYVHCRIGPTNRDVDKTNTVNSQGSV